jgi:hypothetical protein
VILEGLLTTINADGSVNISPMGPLVDEGLRQFVLRPFRTSRTYANLQRTAAGVFHVTDDVELLAHAAVGMVSPPPELLPCPCLDGQIIAGACRWYALRVVAIDGADERTRIQTELVGQGRLRDFFGFNRAKHAVVEAAILATRVHLLPPQEILPELQRLAVPVQKTGGPNEQAAYDFLCQYVQQALASARSS